MDMSGTDLRHSDIRQPIVRRKSLQFESKPLRYVSAISEGRINARNVNADAKPNKVRGAMHLS